MSMRESNTRVFIIVTMPLRSSSSLISGAQGPTASPSASRTRISENARSLVDLGSVSTGGGRAPPAGRAADLAGGRDVEVREVGRAARAPRGLRDVQTQGVVLGHRQSSAPAVASGKIAAKRPVARWVCRGRPELRQT